MKSIFCKKHYLYIYIALAVISLGLAFTTRASAQETDTATTTEDAREDESAATGTRQDSVIGETRGLGGESAVIERGEHKAVLTERVQDRIINLARNMTGRMNAAILRLSQIGERLGSRIEKLKEGGVDTTAAENTLTGATVALDGARAALDGIDDAIVEAAGAGSPREMFQTVRESFATARESINEAHTNLRLTLSLLKSAVAELERSPGVREATAERVEETSTSTGVVNE